jgi:hypothetical protein
MNFSDSFSVLWRRKGLTLGLLILTLLGVGCAGIIVPWTYKASITATLLNSKYASLAIGGGNPYLSFNSSMVETANLLAEQLTSSDNLLGLQQNGDDASFQAQVLSENAENELPFVQISVSGSSQAVVAQTLKGVSATLSTLLSQLQAGVSKPNRLSLQTIAQVSPPVRSSSAKIKPVVGFLAVGLVLTFLIPQAVEGSAARRRRIEAGVAAGDRPRSPDLRPGPESDRFRPNQQPWPDQQAGDDFRGQHASPIRQGGGAPPRSEYGNPGPDGGRYSESDGRWLCILRSIRWNVNRLAKDQDMVSEGSTA